MQVNTTNAVVVSAIFFALSDARFSMRTPAAIRKNFGGAPEAVTDGQIADVSAQLGLRLRRRMRDDAMLIERPASVTADEAKAISERAKAVIVDNAEPFELDYLPQGDAAEEAAEAEAQANAEGDEDDAFTVH